MTQLPPPTSARQPAPVDEHDGWVERPWAARAVGIVIYLVPFASSVAAAFALSSTLPRAPTFATAVVRWFAIAVASTFVLVMIERQTRRLLPLRTLLGLTLAFPDRAPSRFKIAIRTGTTNQLRQRLAEARDGGLGDTPSKAAERLLELVGMLSQHDRLTRGHSERVRAYAHLIGEEMGMSGSELDRLRWAGLLHDVGKLAISTDILNKPGRLTDAEFDVIKTHPMEGKKLVEPLADWLGEAANAVWEHHERFDGTGYPMGLAGTAISKAARIVSVADVFDVMTSVRTYTAATTSSVARKELADCAGTQFDPDVVKAFLAVSVGRVRVAMGPLSWLTQLSMFPTTIASQAGPVLAATTAVAAGTAAGTVGIMAAPTGPVSADETTAIVSTVDVDTADLPAPADAVIRVDIAKLNADDAANDGESSIGATQTIPGDVAVATGATNTGGSSGTTSTEPPAGAGDPTATTVVGDDPVRVPSTTTVKPIPTATTSSTTTTSTTTTTTTTTATTTTTTTATTTIPAPVPSRWALVPGAPGDTPASLVLPLSVDVPTGSTLFNYDTDRDASPGLLIAKDSAGAGGTDPTKVQVFTTTAPIEWHLVGALRLELFVAAKDFGEQDVHVAALIERCDAAGACTVIGANDKRVNKANRFRKANLPMGSVDTTLEPGDRLQVRVAALDDSGDDMWLAFGTTDFDAQVIVGM